MVLLRLIFICTEHSYWVDDDDAVDAGYGAGDHRKLVLKTFTGRRNGRGDFGPRFDRKRPSEQFMSFRRGWFASTMTASAEGM